MKVLALAATMAMPSVAWGQTPTAPSAAPAASSAAAFAPAPPPSSSGFGDMLGSALEEGSLTLKMYGDTSFSARSNNADATYQSTFSTAEPNRYTPGVWDSFAAPKLDLFGSAEVGKLAFLTEVMFEAHENNMTVDTERLQIAYLFANWLRVTAGRKHLAFGYYNDTYHHGNIFELTTSRPWSAQFEDSSGIVLAHNVGVAADGTFDLGGGGAFRYDLEVGNGRNVDITSVAVQYSEKAAKMVNVRLRWLTPIMGLKLGVNAMHDVVPGYVPAMGTAGAVRPDTDELLGGAHVVYTAHDVLVDLEGYVVHDAPTGLAATNVYGAFLELGYRIGPITPYLRPEWIRFPSNAVTANGTYATGADIVYQYDQTSFYYGAGDVTDMRVGIKWLVVPQLALKLEGERLAKDLNNQEIATLKAAFGF